MTGLSPGLTRTGIPEEDDIEAILPDAERLARGPIAIVECFQQIPCDPCSDACSRGAIRPFSDICQLPQVDHNRCNGCGLCVVRCPGLAIFVVDMSEPGDSAVVKLPYEYLPLPRADEKVSCLNRKGQAVCEGRVQAVQRPRSFDRTALITVRVPKGHALQVRGIRARGERGHVR